MKHEQRLVNYLGHEGVESISRMTREWYGPPIAISQLPGRVYATRGGDFVGSFDGGFYSDVRDFVLGRAKRIYREWQRTVRHTAPAGFSSLSDLISEATTGGKKRIFPYRKVGPTGVVGVTSSLWGLADQPPAGANASAAPGGDIPTDATTGAFPFANPTGGDTQHMTRWDSIASSSSNNLLLYDRLFQVNKTMNSTATEAVTGVPTRYQNTTAGQPDSIAGNFLFVEVGGTPLAATAHNWTVCTYTDQANAASTLPSLTGNSAAIVRRLDHPVNQWFATLESGDTGVKALTQMQCSAAVATGVINFVIGHPIAILPHPVANMFSMLDGINSAFNLTRVFDDAALAFLEVQKVATTAVTYSGLFETVSG